MTPATETKKPKNIAEALEMKPQPLWDGPGMNWIGKGDDGKLYIFPGIHNGWSKRQLYRGTMPRNAKQVFAGNAMGTGYLWFDQPLSV
jgi:hypothetical protein